MRSIIVGWVVLLIAMHGSFTLSSGAGYYYRYQNEQIVVTPVHDEISVVWKNDTPSNFRQEVLKDLFEKFGLEVKEDLQRHAITRLMARTLQSQATMDSAKEWLQRQPSFRSVDHVFRVGPEELLLTHRLILQFEPDAELAELRERLEQHGVKLIKELSLPSTRFWIAEIQSNVANGFRRAVALVDQEIVTAAHPELIHYAKLSDMHYPPDDEFYPDQWSLAEPQFPFGQINAPGLWSVLARQEGTIPLVAVMDCDFAGNKVPGRQLELPYVSPYDAVTDTPGVTLQCEGGLIDCFDHGTTVAGAVAAETNNQTKLASLGYNQVGVVPINIGNTSWGGLFCPLKNTTILEATSYALTLESAVVTNCSWGWSDKTPDPMIDDALENLKIYGNGGKGMPIFFASGNDNKDTVSYPANLPGMVAVGASTILNHRWVAMGTGDVGSNYGKALQILAPGEKVPALDTYRGLEGYKLGMSYASGTSIASPMVAATYALMFGRNPSASTDALVNNLIVTADPMVGYNYTTSESHPLGPWNKQTGYGKLNVLGAYQAAYLPNSIIATKEEIDKGINYFVGYNVYASEKVTPKTKGNLTLLAKDKVLLTEGFRFQASQYKTLRISIRKELQDPNWSLED